MYTFNLCGVSVRRVIRPKKSVRDAIAALDLKITEYQEHCSNRRYRNTGEMAIECAEIIGEIKFMYLAGYLKPSDYRQIASALTGQVFDEEVYYD